MVKEVMIRFVKDLSDYSSKEIIWSCILFAFTLYLFRNLYKFIRQNFVPIIAMGVCVINVSGYMYNQIRKPNAFRVTDEGPIWIRSGKKVQYSGETYIVGFLLSTFIAATIALVEVSGGVRKFRRPESNLETHPVNWRRKRLQCVCGLVAMCVVFSLHLKVFRNKIGYYPYSFLF